MTVLDGGKRHRNRLVALECYLDLPASKDTHLVRRLLSPTKATVGRHQNAPNDRHHAAGSSVTTDDDLGPWWLVGPSGDTIYLLSHIPTYLGLIPVQRLVMGNDSSLLSASIAALGTWRKMLAAIN
ncbi:hypothetical protein FHL15_010594 [Xylaria flabelliformis]|uniref:Uncharacterized protein n=1 Tax=Xylaria flabelliformis TaxID=2512241 RepID=A0A553HKS4_9PEZI|nr:hypothetical protein FHL15_010594 [Xylaria flabelliformis]